MFNTLMSFHWHLGEGINFIVLWLQHLSFPGLPNKTLPTYKTLKASNPKNTNKPRQTGFSAGLQPKLHYKICWRSSLSKVVTVKAARSQFLYFTQLPKSSTYWRHWILQYTCHTIHIEYVYKCIQ